MKFQPFSSCSRRHQVRDEITNYKFHSHDVYLALAFHVIVKLIKINFQGLIFLFHLGCVCEALPGMFFEIYWTNFGIPFFWDIFGGSWAGKFICSVENWEKKKKLIKVSKFWNSHLNLDIKKLQLERRNSGTTAWVSI